MTPEQKEAAAEALLAPKRQELEQAQARFRKERRQRRSQRRNGVLALLGFSLGAAVSYALTQELHPGALIALATGYVLAELYRRFWLRRA